MLKSLFDKEKIPAYFAGVIYSSVFGMTFAFTSKALEVMSPLDLPAVRFLFAALFMTLLYFLKVFRVDYKGKNVKKLIPLALCQPILYFICETYGVKLTSSSLSGTMIATIPVVMCILGVFMLKEKPAFKQWVFVLVSVLGAITVVFGAYSSDMGFDFTGFLFLFLAVFASSMYGILAKSLSDEFSVTEITFFMMWFACVIFGIISVVNNKGFGGYILSFKDFSVLLSVLFLGCIGSVVGFFGNTYTVSHLSIASASAFSNFTTVVSVIIGVFLLGESFGILQMIGCFAILIGVFGVNYFENRS
ncbi:DMT family transporter [Anaerofustis sp.]|uniref:DMT family transporter n=1 Tax=Anaerofustis sp. TaxID=1872517 RepID=UPI0025BEF24A|nr:DMT family transporter [Anaerofustis sp.]